MFQVQIRLALKNVAQRVKIGRIVYTAGLQDLLGGFVRKPSKSWSKRSILTSIGILLTSIFLFRPQAVNSTPIIKIK
jgi:hypothetical protein